jgi:hypothetical protein
MPSTPALSQLVDESTTTLKSVPIVYPNGPSASPLSDQGIDNLAIRDIASAEEAMRLLMPNGHFDAPLFQRILTATAKESTFEPVGLTSFVQLLKACDIVQVEELAREWAMEGIKTLIEDGSGVWLVIAHLICSELLSVEDVISQVVQVVSTSAAAKELPESQSLDLLCHVFTLLSADTGAKLHLSLSSFLSLQAIRHRISSNENCLQNFAILFRTLLTLGRQTPETIRGHVGTVMQSPWMLRIATYHSDVLLTQIVEPIVALGDTPALNSTISAFRSLLGAAEGMETDFGENIEQIFKSTNEFSMNLCRINLRLVLEYSRLSDVAVGEKSGEMVERIIASVVGQGQLGKSGDLVKSLNVESKQMVYV